MKLKFRLKVCGREFCRLATLKLKVVLRNLVPNAKFWAVKNCKYSSIGSFSVWCPICMEGETRRVPFTPNRKLWMANLWFRCGNPFRSRQIYDSSSSRIRTSTRSHLINKSRVLLACTSIVQVNTIIIYSCDTIWVYGYVPNLSNMLAQC